MANLEIRTFDYDPYTFDNGTHFPEPKYSYYGSEEPRPLPVDTLILHSMYVPENNELGIAKSYAPEACKNLLETEGVSAHYLIAREGVIFQMVEEDRMAWHAGKSQMPEPDNRPSVNRFSVGVELIGDENEGFTDEQYTSLVGLVVQIMARSAVENILGHSDITGEDNPKTDPWNFNWDTFSGLLSQQGDEEKLKQLKLVGHNT